MAKNVGLFLDCTGVTKRMTEIRVIFTSLKVSINNAIYTLYKLNIIDVYYYTIRTSENISIAVFLVPYINNYC